MSKYPNTGILSKNDRKEQPNHPDYKGQATVDEVEYWLSAWIKDGAKGKFLSISFTPKEDKPKASVETPKPQTDDGPLPF